MIRKGFTFAELMISLVVIAVITAILYPTIAELAPNYNRHLFKSAYKTVELVVSEIVANSTDVNNLVPQTAADLCSHFKFRMNFVGAGDCSNPNPADCFCVNNSFQSSNGMRWFFGANGDIYVDVNPSNNTQVSNCPNASYGQPATTGWADGSFCANIDVTDTFKIQVTSEGRVNVMSPFGRNHLTETELDPVAP